MFITNIIQGITGFAGTVLAMPFSILLVGKDFAKPILNIVGLVVSLVIVIKNHRNIEWKLYGSICLFMGIGMIGGYFLERFLYNEIFLIVYGILICLIAIYYFFIKTPIKLPLWVNSIVMVIAGIIHMIFISGGPLLIIVAKNKIDDKDKFRATLSMVWVTLNSLIMFTNISSGIMGLEHLYMLLILIPIVFLSLLLGKLILRKMSDDIFMKITCVLLFISGLTLLF
ncbi:MAG: sulfite exporter TauE/SafE family protein [Bacilli bacterium]|nr:sulfite exporter TauE/SafE family protein [Bacilli bacterium]